MIILDTNVVSAMMRQEPDAVVRDWMDRNPLQSLWLTSISIYEIRFGIETLAQGRRRRRLEDEFARVIAVDFEARVLPFDESAAAIAARLAGERRRTGRIVDNRDTMIAGIALARRADLATRNVRHFQDLDVRVIDPWTA
jgi:predicted nucleic acid-binding protein